MREQLKWYDEKAHNSPWLDALAELRQRATRESLRSNFIVGRCQCPQKPGVTLLRTSLRTNNERWFHDEDLKTVLSGRRYMRMVRAEDGAPCAR